MAQNAMLRNGGGMLARGTDELTRPQSFERDLHRALGKTGAFRDHPQAGGDRLPSLALRRAVKMEINQESRRLVIVADKVAHQDIEDIIVDRDGCAETWHNPN